MAVQPNPHRGIRNSPASLPVGLLTVFIRQPLPPPSPPPRREREGVGTSVDVSSIPIPIPIPIRVPVISRAQVKSVWNGAFLTRTSDEAGCSGCVRLYIYENYSHQSSSRDHYCQRAEVSGSAAKDRNTVLPNKEVSGCQIGPYSTDSIVIMKTKILGYMDRRR